MTTAFFILLGSMGGIIFLIVHKTVEMGRGKALLSPHIIAKSDVAIQENLHGRIIVARKYIRGKIIRAYIVSIKTAHYLSILFLHRIQDWATKMLERLKGRNHKRNSGSVSFFLKHVSEYKEEMQGKR